MKILIVIPPYRTTDVLFNGLFPMPYGPLIIGTILKQKGHSVVIKDFLIPKQQHKTIQPKSFSGLGAPPYIHYGVPIKDCKEWITKNANQFDAVGLAMGPCNIYETGALLAKHIKSLNLPLIVGGPFVTTATEEALEMTKADVAVIGEGEDVCEQAFAMAIQGKKGLVKGTIVDITKNPIPDFSLIELDNYPLYNGKIRGVLTVSRGCPFDCQFCSVHTIMGRNHRRQSKDRIKEELFNLWNNGVKYFCFLDDNLFINKVAIDDVTTAIHELNHEIQGFNKCRFYIEEGIEVRIAANAGLLKKILSINIENLAIGMETLNYNEIKKQQKPYDKKMLSEAIRNLKRMSAKARAFYIIGFESDTIQNVIDKIIDFEKLDLGVRSNNLKMYPGTNITKKYTINGWISKNYDWRMSSWHTPKAGREGMDYGQIKKTKALLRAISILVTDYGVKPFSDKFDKILNSMKSRKILITINKNSIIIKGNMFRSSPYRYLAEILLLRLGFNGAKTKIEKNELTSFAIDFPVNEIQRQLKGAMISKGIIEQKNDKCHDLGFGLL